MQVTCEIQNQRQEFYCACVDHTRLFPWICKKQTAVSQSSAESEIISLDAGLRKDGLPALLFWECVVDTLSSKLANGDLERHKRERVIHSNSHFENFVFESIDHVPPNLPSSSHSPQLYIFEDNAAVIQIVNQGRRSNIKACHRNAQSRFGLVLRGSELGSVSPDKNM